MSNPKRPTFSRREVSKEETAAIAKLDKLAEQMIAELHAIGGTDPSGSELASQKLVMAATLIRQGADSAKRHVTS